MIALYRRLDQLQRSARFKLIATIAALIAATALFSPVIATSHRIDGERAALNAALANQSAAPDRLDEHAVTFVQTGTVTVEGRTYGGERMRRMALVFFDDDGDLVSVGQLVEELLADQRPGWVPPVLIESPGTTWMIALVAAFWIALVIWMEITLALVLTVLGTAVPVACAARGESELAMVGAGMELLLFFCVLLTWVVMIAFSPPHISAVANAIVGAVALTVLGTAIPVAIAALTGSEPAMLAFAGMGLLTFTFVLLTRAVMILFSYPNQVLAVAHTVVKEATRSRISLVFVVFLLLALPLLPLTLDPESPLRFRIQTFIARSLGLTYALAACMTLFLACATVAFEIRDRQIWQLMTKPLTRINYLAGKWLGVVSVNLVILLVAGVSIFTFTKYLSQLPVEPGLAGQKDRLAVRDEVLTARVGRIPTYDHLDLEQLRARVNQAIERDPDLRDMAEVPRARKNQIARDLQQAYRDQQRSIAASGGERTYAFEGLRSARNLDSMLTLRYRFHILRDDEHARFPVTFYFNENPETARFRSYTPTVTHIEYIEPSLIRDDGRLLVTIVNEQPVDDLGRGEMNFEADDFELLYKVGPFEGNFLRAILMTWVKLSFLAMLGVTTATLLSFPVACLLSFTIFFAGTLGPFLAMSLDEYYPPDPSRMDWSSIGQVLAFLVKTVIRAIAQALVYLLSRFGEYKPTDRLVEGRLIAWSSVATGLFWLGLIWSGIAMIFGWLVMRRRELAIYSGHG